MSRPWKSELTLRPGRERCEAEVRAAWSRRETARAVGEGSGIDGIVAALAALRAQGLPALPTQARLCVPDEQVYLSLRPAAPGWPQALQEAQAHFGALLDRRDLKVQVTPLPGRAGWLAAALEPAELDAWQRTLAEAGIALAHVELAVIDDLRAVADRVGDRAILALMREEGMTLVRVDAGVPVELTWERCDQDSQRCIEQRLLAAQKTAETDTPEPLTMLCRSALQREDWQRRARGHAWTLLLRETPPAPTALDATEEQAA